MRFDRSVKNFFRLSLAGLVLWTAGLLPQGRVGPDPDFAPWEGEVASLERLDQAKPPPPGAVLFAGSSSIRLWDLGRSFPGLDAVNRGFGGSQLTDVVHFAPRLILKKRPRLLVLYAGDNDLAAGKAPPEVADDIRALVELVHRELPRTRILFLSVKISPQRWHLAEEARRANGLVEALCRRDDFLRYVDVATPLLGPDGRPRPELFAPDGLHLNDKGYEVWASVLRPFLNQEPVANR